MNNRAGVAAIVAAAFLFGITFVVVKDAVASFPPLAFVGWRFALGAIVLMLLAAPRTSAIWKDGTIAGLWLFAGFGFQTAGLVTTGASNSALITGLFPVITPLLVALWLRRSPSPWAVAGTGLGFIGLAMLTLEDGLSLAVGDLLTLACAVAFAGHVVYLSISAPRHPVIPFTAVQLLVTAILGLALSVGFEDAGLPPSNVWPALLLTGVGVSAIAFLLQVWAQSRIGAVQTAMTLSLEPVFGVLAAAVILGERLTVAGWFGAFLILVAIWIVLLLGSAPRTTEAESVSPAH